MGTDHSWMSDSGNWSGTSEHVAVHVIAGDIEDIRAGLAGALERLGYHVIVEEPFLKARRGARGWGKCQSSANILDYPATLSIYLKSERPNLTRASFEYVIKYPWLMKGDKQVLSQEAKTLAALALTRARATVCPGCGTEATDDSRFCRRCGAPMTAEAPEIEALRLMTETNAGRSTLLVGQWLLF
ncbi:MAG TPA: zinc ribbon domain-containing protein, partial [Blastocatellia bacterium]|nr:zinc ribbon domain-containing protein [Blastocatellia bacterium]